MTLEGECNRCGLCCTNGDYRCEHLVVNVGVGYAGATRCAVYERRYDEMPIRAIGPEGRVKPALCFKDSPRDTANIVQWIGKGCSLQIADTKRTCK